MTERVMVPYTEGGMAKHSSLSIECVFQARLQETHSNKHKKDSFFFNPFSVHEKS